MSSRPGLTSQESSVLIHRVGCQQKSPPRHIWAGRAHRYPSSHYPEEQGGGAPTLRTPRDLGDEDKGCHRLAGDRQQAKLLSHMQPLVPHRTKVPDYEVECREWEWV